MLIERIVTFANRNTEILFRAMERSLRATGCDLPLEVIPYDGAKFCLPKGSKWFENEALFKWVEGSRCHPGMRKYLCLTIGRYHYIDTDAIFLKNPAAFLTRYNGFVACCTEWSRSQFTYTDASQRLLAKRSSVWRRSVFSGGQYACDQALYTERELFDTCEQEENRQACIEFALHEQPGINLLVALSGVEITNLTLPPYNMESSWAGDYCGDYESLWENEGRMPYVIHYAGPVLDWDLPINKLFFNFLSKDERAQFDEQRRVRRRSSTYLRRWPFAIRLMNLMVRLVDNRFYVQPKLYHPAFSEKSFIKKIDK
jgi:hypothetical protein